MNAPVRTTSSTAVVSLVFGVASWVLLPLIGAIIAVVCGHVARNEIRRAPPGSIDGDGLAVAGMILGYLNLGLCLMMAMFFSTVLAILLHFAH